MRRMLSSWLPARELQADTSSISSVVALEGEAARLIRIPMDAVLVLERHLCEQSGTVLLFYVVYFLNLFLFVTVSKVLSCESLEN